MNMLINRKYCSQILLFWIQSFLTVWWHKKIFLFFFFLSNSSLRILASCHFMLQKYRLQPGTSGICVSSLTGSFLLFSVYDVKKKQKQAFAFHILYLDLVLGKDWLVSICHIICIL